MFLKNRLMFSVVLLYSFSAIAMHLIGGVSRASLAMPFSRAISNKLFAGRDYFSSVKPTEKFTDLHEACAVGDLEKINLLLSRVGTDVNARAKDGNTPLHQACLNGSISEKKLLLIVRALGIRGARLNPVNNDARVPLDYLGPDHACYDILKFKCSENTLEKIRVELIIEHAKWRRAQKS